MLTRIFRNPVFRERDFCLLSIASAFNTLGRSGEQVIFGLLVFQFANSSTWVGLALALYFSPALFLSIPAGALADWKDRRYLLRFFETAIVVIFIFTGALLALDSIELWSLLLLIFASGSLRTMQYPLRSSYAYDLIGAEEIVSGLGALNLIMRFGQLIGALIVGSAAQHFGPETAYFLIAFAHLCALVLLMPLRSAGRAFVRDTASLRQNIAEYLREIRHNRTLLMLMLITACVEILGFSFMTVLPELANNRLDAGAEGLGMMHAAWATGGIVAGIFWGGSENFRARGIAYLTVIYGLGLALLMLAYAPTLILVLIVLVIVATMTASSDILSQSLVQLSVKDRLRGRAMGAWNLAIGSAPLGHLEIGGLAAAFGVSLALTANGAALLCIALTVTIAMPGLRRL